VACARVLRARGHTGPIMGLTLAATALEPKATQDPFESVEQTFQIRG